MEWKVADLVTKYQRTCVASATQSYCKANFESISRKIMKNPCTGIIWSEVIFQLLQKSKKNCNSHLLMSHMRLRKIGPITIGARVRNTISSAFIPHSVGAKRKMVCMDKENHKTHAAPQGVSLEIISFEKTRSF